ncbi:FtsX-like permease family protein [Phytoactinopolyspora limicola]|uniref:FtsX-like permease family protein n=1 Tax=Phytoactinopolyspora limicola TaxID=2715536 RepID=UPI00140A704D|nr:ABC transporter permease [Phytoactinopolyspora limicola]
MIRLAYASLKSRWSAFVAAFLSVFLGTTVIGAFATLAETAGGDVSATDREALLVMGGVVGGWGLAIVLFSVASTLNLTVRQRATEIALLRTVGATPRQARRMLVAETAGVSAVAAALAAVPAWLAGAGLFAVIERADIVAPTVEHQAGVASIGGASVAMVIVSALAAGLASRRATKAAARTALTESTTDRDRMSRRRIVAGVVFLLVGLNYSVLTVTVMADSDDPYAAMATAGPAAIAWAIGLAILAPALLRVAAVLVGVFLRHAGAAGYLAAHNATRRAHRLAGVLMPVIIFVGVGTGTTYLMAIENEVTAGVATSADDDLIAMLNYVVVGMISLFAAIMVVNTTVAVISARRREFGQQRLTGATSRQVTATTLFEGGLVALTGIILGGVASLGTIVPYSQVKLDRLLPDLGIGYFLGVVALTLLLTLGSGYVATRRSLDMPPLQAAASPA